MESSNTSRQVSAGIANFIPPNDPLVGSWSIKYDNPTKDLEIIRNTQSTRPPVFQVVAGDPVMVAISYAMADTTSEANRTVSGGRVRVPFISAAYRYRPAGIHPADPPSYEQDLCKRSNLRQTLTMSRRPDEPYTHYSPISATGGIFSDTVVVHRGPWHKYELLEPPHDLPVVSVAPLRRPPAIGRGSVYKNEEDKTKMREKICGALRICLYHNYDRVVIGDFGLGEGYRNPPKALAEIWRDLLLFDPVLRGQFAYVVFAFENPTQSTTQCHWDNLLRSKERRLSRRLAIEGTSSEYTSPTAEGSYIEPLAPTDMAVFQSVFHPHEIERVLQKPDPRCSIAMVLS
ncbi:hypothetical protein E4U38_006831 [Claviceps purpurea]|nr:hypothetical protein E4U38_006831 [Claviceps purpurea]